jgi:hypothetical protein
VTWYREGLFDELSKVIEIYSLDLVLGWLGVSGIHTEMSVRPIPRGRPCVPAEGTLCGKRIASRANRS